MYSAIILNDTSYERHHGCVQVMKAIYEELKRRDIKIVMSVPVGINWENFPKFEKYILKSDVVIVNGEGTIHDDAKNALDLVKIATYCKAKNIRSVLINALIENNSSCIYEHIKNFDLVYVRDSLSKKELLNNNINCTLVPDLSFSRKFKKPVKRSHQIVITDSVLSDLTCKLYSFSQTDKRYVYLPIFRSPVVSLNDLLSPLKLMKYKIRKIWSKLLVTLSFKLSSSQTRLLHELGSTDSYLNQIASSELIITGRFHALCFAIKTKTPFIALKSNSQKMEALLIDLGFDQNRLLDFQSINNTQLEKIFFFTSNELSKINSYLAHTDREINTMFNKIVALLP